MKKAVILLCILALIVALVGCGSTGNAIGRFKSQVQNNQYIDALETFSEKINGDSALETEAADYLKEYLNSAWQNYLDEKITKKDFDTILLTIQRIDEKINKLGWDLKEIQAKYPEVSASKEAFQNGVSQMADGNYEAAMSYFSQVEPVDTKNYHDAQDRFIQAKEEYIKAIVSTSQEKLNSGDYDGAISVIDTAERTIGSQSGFETVKTEIATRHFEAQMKELDESDKFAAMYALYNQAIENSYCVISAEMTQLLSEKQQEFRKGVIDRSIEAYKANGYEAAASIIGEGLAVLPKDEKFLKYYDLYSSCAPKGIADIQEIDESSSVWYWTSNSDSMKDAFGREYSNCQYFRVTYMGAPYIELFLDGSYSHFSAKAFISSDSSKDREIGIKIYADGICVFDSGMIDRQTEAVAVDLALDNVRILRIEAVTVTPGNGGEGRIVLGDAIFTRTLTDDDLRG